MTWRVLGRVGKGWSRDRVREDITGAFGIPVENKNVHDVKTTRGIE